jgi:hypothetical protein
MWWCANRAVLLAPARSADVLSHGYSPSLKLLIDQIA